MLKHAHFYDWWLFMYVTTCVSDSVFCDLCHHMTQTYTHKHMHAVWLTDWLTVEPTFIYFDFNSKHWCLLFFVFHQWIDNTIKIWPNRTKISIFHLYHRNYLLRLRLSIAIIIKRSCYVQSMRENCAKFELFSRKKQCLQRMT